MPGIKTESHKDLSLRRNAINTYAKDKEVSVFQSLLKHSLIPVDLICQYLPSQGTILDLGCGEGIFANLLARLNPNVQVTGIDCDPRRIEIAKRNAQPNADFVVGNMFSLIKQYSPDAVILNDVVHHQPYIRHQELFKLVLAQMNPGGVIFLKEVDQLDQFDRIWTALFDKKLYPQDKLCFRTVNEWISLFKRIGIYDVIVTRVRHLWPASRTVFIIRIPAVKEIEKPILCDSLNAVSECSTGEVQVLITGATGFIGAHVARRLLTTGINGKKVRLFLLVRDPDRIPDDLKQERVVPLLGELNDLPVMRSFLSNIEYVFHFAAEVKLTGGADLNRHNAEGTESLIQAVSNLKIKRLVHASTMGAVDRLPSDSCEFPLDESCAAYPISEYGRTKLKSEMTVIESGLPYTIIRVTWAYGSGMTPDTHVRNLLQRVYANTFATRFNFPGKVSIIAVEDLARIFTDVVESTAAKNQIYYACDDHPVSLGDLFVEMGIITGKSKFLISVPKLVTFIAKRLRRFFPLAIQNLNSDVLCASNHKLSEVGIRPLISKREGLKRLSQSLNICPYKYGSDSELISLVTGAASGIGKELAYQLYKKGHGLLLIDKNEENLNSLCEELSGCRAMNLDLTANDDLLKLSNYILKNNLSLDWVINNAGIGARGAITDLSQKQLMQIVQLNCLATTYLSRFALKNFLQSGKGTLINIISSSAYQPLPYMSVYTASKAYLLSFSRSITGEFLDYPDIQIMTAIPSGTDTQFQSSSGVKKNANEKLLSASYVAGQIIEAGYKKKKEIVIGNSGKLMAFSSRFIPIPLQLKIWKYLMETKR